MKPEHFQLVRRREVRLLALPLFAGALVFAYWAAPRMQLGWFYRSRQRPGAGRPWWTGAVMTLALFGCALLLTVGFLAWVPRRHMWFTVLGAGTIYGYLLHGFLVKGAGYSGLFDRYAWLNGPAGLVVVSLVAAAAVTVLCTPPVRRAPPLRRPSRTWTGRSAGTSQALSPSGAAPSGRGPLPSARQRLGGVGLIPPFGGPESPVEPQQPAYLRIFLGQPGTGRRFQDREPVRIRVVRQVRLLDQQRSGRGENPPGVRDQVLAVPLGDGEDHFLDPPGQRSVLQPPRGEHAVLHRVVQPGGGDLVLAAAPRPVPRRRPRPGARRTGARPCRSAARWASRAIDSTSDRVRYAFGMGRLYAASRPPSQGSERPLESFGKLITDDSLTHS